MARRDAGGTPPRGGEGGKRHAAAARRERCSAAAVAAVVARHGHATPNGAAAAAAGAATDAASFAVHPPRSRPLYGVTVAAAVGNTHRRPRRCRRGLRASVTTVVAGHTVDGNGIWRARRQ